MLSEDDNDNEGVCRRAREAVGVLAARVGGFVRVDVGVFVRVGTTISPGTLGHVGNVPLTHWMDRASGSMVTLRVRGTTTAHTSRTLVPPP